MASSRFLDAALDDVIKQRSKGDRSSGNGRRGGSGSGRSSGRSSPYNRPSSNDDKWTHDKFGQHEAGGGGKWKHDKFAGGRGGQGGEALTNENNPKIIVENLHYAVTLEDVKELFDTHAGKVKSAEIKYDISGRSTGVAHVIFKEPADAAKAIRKLNGIALDGQVMKITYAPLPVSRRSANNNSNKKKEPSDVFS
ncbi:hypothetical protein BGW41_007573, partial [Actinomortierella wolfii]